MPNQDWIIDEKLLDDMVFEILADDVIVPRPGMALGTKSIRKTGAEEVDEALFRRALFGQPVCKAKEIMESVREDFYSVQFYECCQQALRALVARSKVE